MMNACRVCNALFNKVSYQQIYCSTKCREEYYKQQQINRVAVHGPLNKPIECIECGKMFVRNHSTNVACSDRCKAIRKKRKKVEQNEKHKNSHKYISARKNYVNSCIICGVNFKARMKTQKCCEDTCRKQYSRENNRIRTKKFRKDINIRIAENLRSRVSRAVKNNLKGGSAVDDLGCSIEELKKHLECQFEEGMSWDNYGEWHIDHIKPLAKYDLTNKQQFKKAANYKNLQPLWAKDNISKGAK